MCRLHFILLTLCFALVMAWPVWGQSDQHVVKPLRLRQLFDFEDTDAQGYKLGLGHALPRDWYAIGRDPLVSNRSFHALPIHKSLIHRPGYPTYSTVAFDDTHQTSGDYSLKLAVNGGNAGAFLECGALPALSGSDYRVTVKVRTQDMQGTGACVCAYYLDASGRQIESSFVRSSKIQTKGQWVDVSVSLPGDFENVAWIGIELEVLQPKAQEGHPLGKQQLIFQDIDGQAWFDDIAVWQLPHVQVSTSNPLNIHKGPTPPPFEFALRDLTGRQLIATVVIYDHAFREVDRSVRQVGAGAPTQWSWTPKLPGYGWYLADLRISEGESSQRVARTFGAVQWLPQEPPILGGDRSRFTFVAEDLPVEQMKMLSPMLETTGIGSVVLSVWDRQTTLATLTKREAMLDAIVSRLTGEGRAVTLSLNPVPTALSQLEGVSATEAVGVLQADPGLWLAYLQPVLRQHGQRVRRWQLGAAELAETFFYDDPMAILDHIRREFEALAPRPTLVVPWRMDQSRRAELDRTLTFAMDVGPGVSAEMLASHLEEWLEEPASDVALYLRESAANEMSPQSRIDSLALRMIMGWRHQVDSLAIARPWTKAAERRKAILPDPLLGVFVNVAHRLAGRKVVAEALPIGKGLRAMVFDGSAGGMIVAWAESASPDETTIRMVLGDSPVAVDVWGNRTPLSLVKGKHELKLTTTPTFIEEIDPHLALLRASFRVNDSFIESSQKPHRRTIRLTNPYSVTITGRLRITGPDRWDISPVRHMFSLGPGQTAELPVVMNFPLAEIAGSKRLTARVEFDSDRHYNVDLTAPMEVGLRDIHFSAVVTREPGKAGATDAMLTVVVTNIGDKPRSLYLFAILPDHPREERFLADLLPGQSVIKRLRFNDIERGATIRTGVRETNGPAMLNHLVRFGD